MPSLIRLTIGRLRRTATRFNDRVAGLAELNRLREEQNLSTPSAFVLPGGESVTQQHGQGGVVQSMSIRTNLTILVWLDANADPRGQHATMETEDVRDELTTALLSWRPTADHEGFSYRGMDLGGQDQDRAVFLYQFATTQHLKLGCGRVVIGGVDPAVAVAQRLEAFHEAPTEVDPVTGALRHRRGVGLTWSDAGCAPPLCATPAFSTQINEDQT
jgi:hypothetical protein